MFVSLMGKTGKIEKISSKEDGLNMSNWLKVSLGILCIKLLIVFPPASISWVSGFLKQKQKANLSYYKENKVK